MDEEEFQSASRDLTQFIINYHHNIDRRRVLPAVKPGYIQALTSSSAPEHPHSWRQVLEDLEPVVLSGVTHWQSPHFFAYFPTGCSYPSILADMLSDAIGCVGFSWMACPASTELEVRVMDWLARAIGLPQQFLSCPDSPMTQEGGAASEARAASRPLGGGVIQGTASESTLLAVLSARQWRTAQLMSKNATWTEGCVRNQLVAYCSDQAHSSVEKAAMLAAVTIRMLPTNSVYALTGDCLRRAINEDVARGMVPFVVIATLGTTGCCAFDCLEEIGRVCEEMCLWLHVDAAYAGSAFICPEFRYLMRGVSYADSFNFNPHKWMLVNFDCSALWLKNSRLLIEAFNTDPLYLKHEYQHNAPDFRHWQIPLGRRFRALKLWFVLRLYGLVALREYIRGHVRLARLFEELVSADTRFEVCAPVTMALVCFRLKVGNAANRQLLRRITDSGRIYLVPTMLGERYCLRLAICSAVTREEHVVSAWEEIRTQAEHCIE